jgi:adhesin/invasin
MSFLSAFRRTKAAGFGLVAALILTMVWSCTDSSTAPPPPNTTPSSVTPAAGTDNQTALAGAAVAVAPSVTITNSDGSALNGTSVLFAVASGGGSVTPGTVTTDAQGVATVTSWTLGTTAGTNTLLATAGNATFTFTATGTAGPAASVAIEAGDGQTATTGMAVAVPPAVKVVDANNNPVSGATVTFTAMNNSVVAGSPATTDANGIAAATSWTMGDLGANTLEASVADAGPPAVFNATSIGIPTMVTIVAGNNQNVAAGTVLPVNPSVEVRDASMALLANIPVTFAVTGGDGSVTGANATTDASGIATVGGWTLGTTPGVNLMDATVTGVGPETFTATGVVGPASQIQITAGDAQTATVGTALGSPAQATLQDQFGNGVAGADLTFAPSGTGSVDNTTVTTDANGNASVTWTLGTAAGAQTLDVTSTIGGVTPATANATATADVATTLAISAGDNQSATQGTAVATAPAVLVTDQFGNPVAGVAVTFAPSGDGTVTGSPATSDAMGIATLTQWQLTSATGANTLTASATGTTAVIFNATATVQIGSITRNTGDGQTATVNTAVATALSVLVQDVSNNPAPNIPVTFAVTLGGGSVTAATSVLTDGSGIATVGSWTLGQTAGANEVNASVDSDPATHFVLFGATGTAGAATTMAVSAGDNQSTGVGTAVAVAPAVLVQDQFNNAVSGVSVAFAPSADGQVTMSPATTGTDGIATVGSWTLATAGGANTLTASATGLTSVVFNATGTVTTFVMALLQGNDQTGPLTGPLPVSTAVRVTDQGTGNPVVGQAVSFTPRAGEGSVNNATVLTDANGDASVQWTPGRTGSNFMDVVAGNASTQFFSIGSNSAYHVELRFLSPTTTTMVHKQTFGDAAARWMSVITGDTPGANLTSNPFPANACFGMPNPQVTDIIDDIIIFVDLAPIDGPGGTLGFAGPCGRFTGQMIPIIGGMTFDTADLANMIANGTFNDVILHEMGHVVGIGTLWNRTDIPVLLTNPSCPSTIGADTHFTGTAGLAEFAVITGGPWTGTVPTTSPIPVENQQGNCPGTRDGHWRESTFATELMTGFISGASNPLSRTTIASVQDLGYVVDLSQADPYTLFSTTAVRALTQSGVHLGDDIARGPTILFLPGGGYRVEIIE